MSFINLSSYKDLILVATDNLNTDYNFQNTVIYLFKEDNKGVSGVVINRQSSLSLEEIKVKTDFLPSVTDDELKKFTHSKILAGGPLSCNLPFLLSGDKNSSSTRFCHMTHDILQNQYDVVDIVFGFVFWPIRTLKQEIEEGCWQAIAYNYDLIHNVKVKEKYNCALNSLSVKAVQGVYSVN